MEQGGGSSEGKPIVYRNASRCGRQPLDVEGRILVWSITSFFEGKSPSEEKALQVRRGTPLQKEPLGTEGSLQVQRGASRSGHHEASKRDKIYKKDPKSTKTTLQLMQHRIYTVCKSAVERG